MNNNTKDSGVPDDVDPDVLTDEEAEAFLAELLADDPPGPTHHYALAHHFLRQHCFMDPARFFDLMYSPERDGFMAHVWNEVCAICDPHGPAPFGLADVIITSCYINDIHAIIVAMPPPGKTGEAHFVGITLALHLDENDGPEKIKVTYLTLEKGLRPGKTVLCEWRDDEHANYGEGPPPTQEAFMAAMGEMIGG
jgi:hypothetical protein